MKQTAVEWLYKNLLENPISNQDVEYNEAVFHNAKEMEKQQIIDAYNENENYMCDGTEGEQYYKETFKNKFTITTRITNDNINVTKIN